MGLSSLQLDAFVAVVKSGSFSAAAKALHITQSALSQRVLNLEQELETTLLVRDPAGVRTTEVGQRLFNYCRNKDLLEDEFLSSFKADKNAGLSGVVRVAGFSTIVRSVLIPIFGDFTKNNPAVNVEIYSAELSAIPGLLASGRADFVLLTHPIEKAGIENVKVGIESNVLIEPKKGKVRDIYLDHDEADSTTHDFFKLQGKKQGPLQRNYLDEIYAIVDGVRHGMGRAVIPEHIARDFSDLEIVGGYKPLKVPIYLAYYSQAFYSELQKALIEKLSKDFSSHL